VRIFRSRKWTASIVGGVAVIGTCTGVALASMGVGFVGTNLVADATNNNAVHLNSDRIKFQTKDPTHVRVQQVNFDAGGRSGWHHHPGFVLVAVKTGQLTVFDSNCNSTTYGPGSPNGAVFVEYGDSPLEVRNLTTLPAVSYTTYVVPDVSPAATVFRIEDDPPACATP
jgi:hypothetical protein